MYTSEQLDLFYYPARIIISGFSNSGKSHLASLLIRKYEHKFNNIIVCGVKSHPLQQELADKMVIHENIVDPSEVANEGEISLMLVDDSFLEAVDSKIIADSFTKGRHINLSIILITQNLFFKGKYARTIGLNASHYILLKNRDMGQIEVLGRQIFGKEKAGNLLQVYKQSLANRPFGYLLIDLSMNTPDELQLRSNIAGENPFEIVYQWNTKI